MAKKAGPRKSIQKPRAKASLRNPARRRANPDELEAAAELSEKFHGRPARKVREIAETRTERTELTELGRLIELQVELADGRNVAVLTPRSVRLACSADGGQLYFIGGDQELDLAKLGLKKALPKDHLAIGAGYKITYHTSKAFHDFEPSDYEHEFGEESGVRPTLCYDVLNQQLYMSGGRYQVRPEGIVD